MSTTKKTPAKYEGFTTDERDAMKERAKELKAGTRRGTGSAQRTGRDELVH